MRRPTRLIISVAALLLIASLVVAQTPDRVKSANGVIEGAGRQSSGVRIFKGIPFAQPPVGDLRWKEPQPISHWSGVRPATQFGPRCTQAPIFDDMVFRSNGVSEDCLYLNVWTPAKTGKERLPVLVYFYGGGFVAGDGSELRYDGESMAAKGIVAVTVNYRLGVFGFMAHPELTKESPHSSSGNYGLLDQYAALRWVTQDISAFGGDPKQVTIAGESAGSISVSAQMASPLAKGLIAGAIGESGGITGALPAVPRSQAEQAGVNFASSVGASSLAALRSMTSQQILEPASKGRYSSVGRFPLTVDGYFFTEDPAVTYAAGRQAHVPLLVGWNSEERSGQSLFSGQEPTPENYEKVVRETYGERAVEAMKLYPVNSREQVVESATALAGDRFIGYSTWKWVELHRETSGSPVYRYFYAHPRPAMKAEQGNGANATAPIPRARGAVHSAEIEYALGNLSSNKVYAWTDDDYKVSKIMQEYFANFIKKRDPNGPGLPPWRANVAGDGESIKVMRLEVNSSASVDKHRARYLFLDEFLKKQ